MGIGAFDIFHTNIDDNLNTRDVVNLGYPFNSPNDDLSFVSIDGKKAIFHQIVKEVAILIFIFLMMKSNTDKFFQILVLKNTYILIKL